MMIVERMTDTTTDATTDPDMTIDPATMTDTTTDDGTKSPDEMSADAKKKAVKSEKCEL